MAPQTSSRSHAFCSAIKLTSALAALALAALAAAPAFAANVLTQAVIGDGDSYTRLTFLFQEPLGEYTVKKEDGGRILADLGVMETGDLGALPEHKLISGLSFSRPNGRLLVEVRLKDPDYDLKQFPGRNRYSLNLDFSPPAQKTAPAAQVPEEENPALKPLTVPTLTETAAELSRLEPLKPDAGPADCLLQRILSETENYDYPSALADIDFFLKTFPRHPRMEVIDYLKAELDFLSGPPDETYAVAVGEWQAFMEKWPDSRLVNRARYFLAEADRLLGHANEAAAGFALSASAGPPDDPYARLALLKAADLYMGMGVTAEARKILAPVLNEGVADRLGWEVYARAGAADFYQGFYAQAIDILREVLIQVPGIQTSFPDILYAAGESYHYLGRPDLARHYLLQAVNLQPNHPKADVILTRIGDSYRQEGLDREAIAVYGAVGRNYPQGEGGLISKVRLADMGALHSFFSQDKVFDALERGSRQATVDMYKSIASSGLASPLIQLAQLKIGSALAEDGETDEAVKWLRDLEMSDPKSPLLAEAMPTLNEALADEMALRQELGEWRRIADLYADNSYYIADQDRPRIERIVAQAYEHLGRFNDALELWVALDEKTPERRLARARRLVEDSLKIDRAADALKYILEMESEFPEERAWLDERLVLVGRSLARPHDAEATESLLDLRAAVSTEPVRRDALSAAISIEVDDRRYDRAVELIGRYREEYPLDELSPEYLLTEARIEEYRKRPDRSWDILSEFRQDYPDDPRGRELLRGQMEKADRLGRQDDAFRFMELYRDRYPEDPAGRDLLMTKINRLWEAGRYGESRDALNAFRRDYPDDPRLPEILMGLSERDWEIGRFQEAKRTADEFLAGCRDCPEALNFLSRRAERDWERGRYQEARDMVYDLLANYPGDSRLADLLLKRAEGDWSRGRLAEAREDWNDFRLAFPDEPRLGRSYLDEYKKLIAAGQPAEAFRLADDFRALRPQDGAAQADLMLEQAKDYFALKQPGEGLNMWERFRRTFPDDDRNPDLLLIQARQEFKGGLGEEALRHYRRFIEAYPGDSRVPAIHLETAAAEMALDRPLEAWGRLNGYIESFPAAPGRPQAILDAVELGRQLGFLKEAADLLALFRRDYPDAPETQAGFLAEARLRLAAGDRGGAVAVLENGVLSRPVLDRDQEVQSLLTELYLEEGRVEDWAALTEKNLNRSETGGGDRFRKYYQLAQVYQELGRSVDVERNLDAALANRAPGLPAEELYAAAQSYKRLLRPEKYRAALELVRDAGEPLWQKIATDELAAEAAPSS